MLLKIRSALLLVLLLVTVQTLAKDRPFIDEPDSRLNEDYQEQKWQEGESTLPSGYDEKNLQEFQLNTANAQFRYFIDRSSLQTGDDGVTRFLLVIRSRNDAVNTSYEGIRCGQRQYKVYAYGAGQDLNPMPNPIWQHISKSGAENYRNTLYQDLLCDSSTGEANSPEMVFHAMETNNRIDGFFINQD